MSARTYTVAPEHEGLRVDQYLGHVVEGLGRSSAKRLIAEGRVRVNARRQRKGERLRAGDKVAIEGDLEVAWSAAPDPDLPLAVLHENSDVVAVDKPAGVPTHPLRAGERGTIANALVARYPEMSLPGVGYGAHEPGVVHRLDTDTSGVLVAARTPAAFAALRDELRAGRIEKEYVALVEGAMEGRGTIAFALAPAPKNRRKVAVCRTQAEARRLGGRPAETRWEAERVLAPPDERWTLLRVVVDKAQRHQIRAHLAAVGHPIAGDALYGGRAPTGVELGRHLLHAIAVRLKSPSTGETLEIRAPLPPDFRAALETLGGTR